MIRLRTICGIANDKAPDDMRDRMIRLRTICEIMNVELGYRNCSHSGVRMKSNGISALSEFFTTRGCI